MRKLRDIAFLLVGVLLGTLAHRWLAPLIDPEVWDLTGAVFWSVAPVAFLCWFGFRARRFAAAVLSEGRFPPAGWEERYGPPTQDPSAVTKAAREASWSARAFFAVGAIWLLGAGFIAYVA